MSRRRYFCSGRTISSFQIEGKIEVDKDKVDMTVIIGRITGRMSLINLIGILSATTALLDILKITVNSSASDTGFKEKR